MGDQTARDPIFSTTCARCGGTLSEPVSFCPHCGVHARLAYGDRAPAKKPGVATASATASATGARANGALAELLWPSRPTPLFESAEGDPYSELRPPSPGVARTGTRTGARQWGVKTGTALTLLAFLVLFGAVVLLHRYDDSAERKLQEASKTVEGRVTASGTSQSDHASTTAQGTVAQRSMTAQGSAMPQSAPPVQGSTTAAVAPPPTVAASTAPATTPLATASAQPEASEQPETPAPTGRAAGRQGGSAPSVALSEPSPPPATAPQRAQSSPSRSQATKASASGSTTSGKGYGDKNRRLMSLALARAHNGLDKNDLRMARSGVYWALSLQPDNSEALMLKRELVGRERAGRDRR